MKINKAKVKKILVINLSNIGDAVLTTPVIQVLKDTFPRSHLTVLAGVRAFSVFKNDTRIDQKIIYDKSISNKNKLLLINRLRQERYDLVVDLRQSLFNLFLGAKYHTSLFRRAPKSLVHMKDRHLWKLKSLGLKFNPKLGPSVLFSKDDRDNINQLLYKWQLQPKQMLIAVAPGARSKTKRWQTQGFKQLIELLIKELHAKIVLVGDQQDELLVKDIIAETKLTLFNVCAKTSISELAFLLSQCNLLISNDSAPMHIAWAVKTPVVAIFGPTDYKKYAPQGKYDIVVRKNLACAPCRQSLCPKGTRECMKSISADEVFAACKKILNERKKL